MSAPLDEVQRYLNQQLETRVPAPMIVRAALSRWPELTPGDLIRANATVLARRAEKVANEAAAVGAAIKAARA